MKQSQNRWLHIGGMRFLFPILFLISVSTLHAKRVEMSISDIKSLSTHIFIGFTDSLDGGAFKIIVLKKLAGPNDLKEKIEIKQLPVSKPTENPEVGKTYLFFLKKRTETEHEIIRRLEVGDFQVLGPELSNQKIKTKCGIATVECLLK